LAAFLVRHDGEVKTPVSRQVLLGVLAVALVVLAWVVVRATQAPSTPAGQRAAAGATYTLGPLGTDPDSGRPWVAESALPPQARNTLALIRAGGPFPYPRSDNQVFDNRERLLPPHARGYYREFTVVTPGSDDRGARRIITGSSGEKYWTDNHYASFSRIREGT
jgi:guanyl-specific ribonuclease Sa